MNQHPQRLATQPNRSVRIALVGCGAVSQQFYVPSLSFLQETGRLTLVCCVDPNKTARQIIQNRFPQAVGFDALNQIQADSIDLAIVATPPKFHCEQACESLQNGWHVLCEKPMAYHESEASKMIETARKADRLLAIGHYKRFFPSAQEIKTIIETRVFGNLRSFAIHEGGKFGWPAATDSFFRKDITPGGILLDIGVHVLDLLIYWLGEPSGFTYADDAIGGLEANAQLDMQYENGISGHVFLTREWKTAMSYTFHFEKAVVSYRVNDANGLSIRLTHSPRQLKGVLMENQPFGAHELAARTCDTNAQSFIRQLENVIDAIHGKAPLLVDGTQGLAPLRLIRRCYDHRHLIPQPWLSPEEEAAALETAKSRHATPL